VVERHARPMITVLVEGDIRETEVELSDDAAQHVRVRRARSGEPVRIVNGRGAVGTGSLLEVGKRTVRVAVSRVEQHPRPVPLVALVPVADRDRMLWAAEKCVELQVTRWQPVLYERSRSVSPRGEGEKFAAKVRARMAAALEQCGGAWLPEVNVEVGPADAWGIVADCRLLFERGGTPAIRAVSSGTTAVAVGPEGGFEKTEIEDALRHGWNAVSLGPTTLRFETAIVAAAAVIRATQL
jgi:16S rRNA (uracil1498-N3)-methyltransferase